MLSVRTFAVIWNNNTSTSPLPTRSIDIGPIGIDATYSTNWNFRDSVGFIAGASERCYSPSTCFEAATPTNGAQNPATNKPSIGFIPQHFWRDPVDDEFYACSPGTVFVQNVYCSLFRTDSRLSQNGSVVVRAIGGDLSSENLYETFKFNEIYFGTENDTSSTQQYIEFTSSPYSTFPEGTFFLTINVIS